MEGIQLKVFPAPELLVWAGWPKMLPLCAKIAVLAHFGPNPGQRPFYLLEGFQMKVFPAPEILVWAGCPKMLPLCAKIAVLGHFGPNPGPLAEALLPT